MTQVFDGSIKLRGLLSENDSSREFPERVAYNIIFLFAY